MQLETIIEWISKETGREIKYRLVKRVVEGDPPGGTRFFLRADPHTDADAYGELHWVEITGDDHFSKAFALGLFDAVVASSQSEEVGGTGDSCSS